MFYTLFVNADLCHYFEDLTSEMKGYSCLIDLDYDLCHKEQIDAAIEQECPPQELNLH